MRIENVEREDLPLMEGQKDDEVEETQTAGEPEAAVSELAAPAGTFSVGTAKEALCAHVPKIGAQGFEAAMKNIPMKEIDVETVPFVEDPSTVVDVEMATDTALVEDPIEKMTQVRAAHRST